MLLRRKTCRDISRIHFIRLLSFLFTPVQIVIYSLFKSGANLSYRRTLKRDSVLEMKHVTYKQAVTFIKLYLRCIPLIFHQIMFHLAPFQA